MISFSLHDDVDDDDELSEAMEVAGFCE